MFVCLVEFLTFLLGLTLRQKFLDLFSAIKQNSQRLSFVFASIVLIIEWIIIVRTQPYLGWLLYSWNHACLTLVHISSNSYFVTCSTPPTLKDSEHGRYYRSPPGYSSTERTTSSPLEIRLKLRLMQRVCRARWKALTTNGLEHGCKC